MPWVHQRTPAGAGCVLVPLGIDEAMVIFLNDQKLHNEDQGAKSLFAE